MSRVDLKDSTFEAFFKISEGNPGALNVIMELAKGGTSNIIKVLYFDTMGVYGSDIWVLYKDCCAGSIEKVSQVLRAWQLGQLSIMSIKARIAGSKPFDELPSEEEMLSKAFKYSHEEATP